jgi:hypothetical protein
MSSSITDLGVLPVQVETDGQRSRFRGQLEIGPVTYTSEGKGVNLSQTVIYPARQDETIETELPLHVMKRLRNQLDDRIDEIEDAG